MTPRKGGKRTKKKYIIVAGLNGCAKQKKFGFICDLIPLCNKITKLSAICTICNDGTPGDFTKIKDIHGFEVKENVELTMQKQY